MGSVERRLELSESEQEFWADIHPDFMTMHELASNLPCECVHFLMYDFAGPYWSMIYDTPSFTGWQLEHLETLGRVYRLHRRMLQTFAHEAPDPGGPRRWLLKSPFHVSTLPALFAEYPDARVIHTHRDPRRFLASLVSSCRRVRFMRSDAVDVAALAPIMEATYEMFLDGTIAQREDGTIPNDRIVDSHFVELMARPGGEPAHHVRPTRARLARRPRRAITDYLASKPKGKHGAHAYSFADVGLDDASRARDVRALCRPLRHHRGVTSTIGTTFACGVSMSPSGEEEAPEHHAERTALGVEPVRDAGILVRDHHRERAVGVDDGLRPVERHLAVRVVVRLQVAVPQRHVGAAALGPARRSSRAPRRDRARTAPCSTRRRTRRARGRRA